MTGFFIIVKDCVENGIKYEERKIKSSSSSLKVTIIQPEPINWLTPLEWTSKYTPPTLQEWEIWEVLSCLLSDRNSQETVMFQCGIYVTVKSFDPFLKIQIRHWLWTSCQ
jgi:hypothetical protein